MLSYLGKLTKLSDCRVSLGASPEEWKPCLLGHRTGKTPWDDATQKEISSRDKVPRACSIFSASYVQNCLST